jgi:SNF2 family DNA or RNA helicase
LNDGNHQDAHGLGEPVERIDPKDVLKFTTFARLAAVHLACQDAAYRDAMPAAREVTEADANIAALDDPAVEAPVVDELFNNERENRRSALRRRVAGGKWKSSRIEAALKTVKEHFENNWCKIVVFAAQLCLLDVFGVALEESSYTNVLRFDGTVGEKRRDFIERAFAEEDRFKIVLITTRSGGVGRTFAAANGVLLLTPCYSSTMMAQAIDRIVRSPNKQAVHAYHMRARDSVEQRVVYLRGLKRGKAYNLLDPDWTVPSRGLSRRWRSGVKPT